MKTDFDDRQGWKSINEYDKVIIKPDRKEE